MENLHSLAAHKLKEMIKFVNKELVFDETMEGTEEFEEYHKMFNAKRKLQEQTKAFLDIYAGEDLVKEL